MSAAIRSRGKPRVATMTPFCVVTDSPSAEIQVIRLPLLPAAASAATSVPL